jgi:hypothetical protein
MYIYSLAIQVLNGTSNEVGAAIPLATHEAGIAFHPLLIVTGY